MKGAKPKELSSKLLIGNKDRKRFLKSKVIATSKPRRPYQLPPQAKKFWNENSDNWYRLGKLNDYTLPIFDKICRLAGKIEALEEKLGENVENMVQTEHSFDTTGAENWKQKESATSKLLRYYYTLFRTYMKDAGVSPSEMRGLYEFVGEEDGQDTEDEF